MKFSPCGFALFFLASISLFNQSCNENSVANGNENNSVGADPSIGQYSEKYRPQYHFTPAEKWMNDPNGLVYYEGEYHLFYQFYPDSNVWGPMHWGHAISKDLVKWQHLPIALYPDSLGYIFSGSAVVDWNNTSGLGQNGKPPLVAIFTYHNPIGANSRSSDFQYQAIAFSNDNGRSWTKYEGNPVVPNEKEILDFRDPKVIWDDRSDQWVMVFAAGDHLMFWGSPDLKNWEHLSDWGEEYGNRNGVWECPDLFPMTVKNTGETKWVLLLSLNPGHPNGGSGTQYFVGEFDGKNFLIDKAFEKEIKNGQGIWLDYGRDNYAGVTWSDIPKADGRRLWIGWMSNWDYAQIVPTTVWRSAMTLPRELTLKKTDAGYRISMLPVAELKSIRGAHFKAENIEVDSLFDLTPKLGFSPTLAELVLEFEIPNDTQPFFGAELSNAGDDRYRIGFNAAENLFYSDRTRAGGSSFSTKFGRVLHKATRTSKGNTLKMHLFVDTSSAELFADDGSLVMTNLLFPTEHFNGIRIFSENGKVVLKNVEVFEMQSIWH